MRVGGATSQFDLPSLTPLSVAGRGQLQLGLTHWATSVYYCKQLIIDPTFCGSKFSTGRLLAIVDYTFFTFMCFFLLLKNDTLATRNECSPTVFDLDG